MSEARHQRFEIDIDEIERQLRSSAAVNPTGKPDPLAELARIVGQDDPFRGGAAGGNSHSPNTGPGGAIAFDGRRDPVFDAPRGSRPGAAQPQDDLFDPVSDVYGSPDGALMQEDIRPLQARRSRGRLALVMAAMLVSVGAVAGGLYWRKTGGMIQAGGAPPIITADKTPLKVVPENPGGIDVPNQGRQIYDRKTTDGQSRVVDGREQPIDVREAAKAMPEPAPTISARSPVPTSDTDAAGTRGPSGGSTVSTVLGEPRRVRTVAVRPDGTTYTPGTASAAADPAAQSVMPGGSLPPPVPVMTVPVPSGNPASMSAASGPTSVIDSSSQGLVTSSIIPPPRPRGERKAAVAAADTPVRTASVDTTTDRTAEEKPAANKRTFSVQVAVKPTEEEARAAYSALQGTFGSDLEGRRARFTQAEVGGKTVHRVRVGPMTKDDADSLCGKLKSSGGSCFVTNSARTTSAKTN